MNIYQESVRTEIICDTKEVIWFYDAVVWGLYVMNKSTFEVTNILNSFQLFKNGKYKVKSIIKSENNIIIVPEELNKNWIIYNVITKELQYKFLFKEHWKTVEAHVIGKKLILIPFSSEDPIIIICLKTFTTLYIIDDWSDNDLLKKNKVLYVWGGIIVNEDIFFPIYNTNYIVKISKEHIKKDVIHIPSSINCISLYNDEIWILPTDGYYIYVSNFDGKIIDSIKLTVNNQLISSAKFIRIVTTFKFVFLLPFNGKEIYAYDRNQKRIVVIVPENNLLQNEFIIQSYVSSYWEYYINKNKICFLPLNNRLLIIDLDTLELKQKDVFLPKLIENYQLRNWDNCNTLYDNNFIMEGNDAGIELEMYLKFIKNTNNGFNLEKKYNSKRIWNEMKTLISR